MVLTHFVARVAGDPVRLLLPGPAAEGDPADATGGCRERRFFCTWMVVIAAVLTPKQARSHQGALREYPKKNGPRGLAATR
jgi:hypothetical protein